MRFQAGHAEVLSEGFGETATFTIAANAKAFKGLIDGLYSRKIEAVMRELATNAFDAHKMVASIAPFDIHLPTPLKPSFWIRDYGPGMSHYFMMNRFTVMFDSTKDGLNAEDSDRITPDEQVGCLGLGRMSFFAYTDSCTITVWQDGEARYYTVFMGPDGEPKVAHAGDAASDEPDGVKVEFAAKARDFKSFATAAIRVFKGFAVQPKGLPIDVRDAIATEPLEIGAFWKAYPKSYLPDGGFYARQGCVLYPIDLTQIDDRLVVTDSDDDDGEATIELSENYARFASLDMTIVLDFPIGLIDFDLSRERLAYNDRTVAAIRDRWSEFVADLDSVIEKAFAGKDSTYERLLAARSPLFEGLGPLFQQTSFFLEAGDTETFIYELLPYERRRYNSQHHAFKKVIEFRDEDDKRAGDNLRDTVFTYNQRMSYQSPEPDQVKNAIFVYNDDTSRALNARVHHHLRQIGKRYAYVFEVGGLTLARWRKMGRPPILRTSEIVIPKEVREKIERKGVHGGGGVFDRIKVIDNCDLRAPREDEDVEDHLFAFINRGELINPDASRYPDMTKIDVINLHYLLVGTGGPAISIINTRSNDKPGRWDHLPVFYDVLDTFAERLSKKQVGQFIAWLNDSRFSCSKYAKALGQINSYGRSNIRGVKNPLTALNRFRLSKGQTDPELTPRYCHLISSTNPALVKIVNDIIHIATGMGMEVLPPRECDYDGFAVPLLPPDWERTVDLINSANRYSGNLAKAHKAFFALLMQHTT